MPVKPNNVNNNDSNTPNLLKSSGIVATATMLSRILGLARDIVIVSLFGTSAAVDAFLVAFKIPNYFRRLFAEGAFIQGFVPVLTEYREKKTIAEMRQLISHTWGVLGFFLLLLTALVIVFAPWVIIAIAPGFKADPQRFKLAEDMLRLTFLYLPLIASTALAAGVLNVYQQFTMPSLAPIWLNVCLICAALWLSPHFDRPIMALAWAVLVAGIVQCLFLFPSLIKRRLLVVPIPNWRNPGVRHIIRLMLPAMFAASVSQLNLLIDLFLASFLTVGSISWLYYSDRLIELPVGVIGVALAVVILPSLSKDHLQQNRENFIHTLDWALRLILVIGMPCVLAIILISEPILATLFLHGVMTTTDIEMTALSLDTYAIGIPGFMAIKILAAGYFARQDVKTPLKIAIVAMLLNIFLNLMFIQWLAHAGLALATSIAALVNAAMLFYGLYRLNLYRMSVAWVMFLFRLCGALIMMSIALWFLTISLDSWIKYGLIEQILRLIGLCVVGTGVYFATLWLLGMRISDFNSFEKRIN